jgi:hypothetical protein
MSRKIIGVTVGSSLPKPNFKQTDPTKGDYIKNKPDFEGLKYDVEELQGLVGTKSVSEQINEAFEKFDGDSDIYVQNDEPVDAPDGSLWVDLDAQGIVGGGSIGGTSSNIAIDTTLTQSGQAADAKAVGDKFIEFEKKVSSGVSITDDGYGNIAFEIITSNMSVTDDGNGNITIS